MNTRLYTDYHLIFIRWYFNLLSNPKNKNKRKKLRRYFYGLTDSKDNISLPDFVGYW